LRHRVVSWRASIRHSCETTISGYTTCLFGAKSCETRYSTVFEATHPPLAGVARPTDQAGVLGVHKANGAGVAGFSETGEGVLAESRSGNGIDGTGAFNGVVGRTNAAAHSGILGLHSGGGRAVSGLSEVPGGIGIWGRGTQLAGKFEGDVEVTGSVEINGALTFRGVDVLQRIDRLERLVDELERRLLSSGAAPTPPKPSPPTSSKPRITSVTFKEGKYLVSAVGLNPNQIASVDVRDDQSQGGIVGQQTASSSGTLDSFPVSVNCIAGTRLHFVVSSDLNNSNLTSERFTTTCQ
jgi:hypothetical protein